MAESTAERSGAESLVMAGRRRVYRRNRGTRRVRRSFLLAVEGRKTEPQYFAILNEWVEHVQIPCLKCGGRTTPEQIAKLFEDHLNRSRALRADEEWVVVDRDHKRKEDLAALIAHMARNGGREVVVSNPKFEYWLLLHYDDGAGLRTVQECDSKLKSYLPRYSKGIVETDFSLQNVAMAIERARRRDKAAKGHRYEQFGTTVYKLVAQIVRD